jgi:transposase InsO family protein
MPVVPDRNSYEANRLGGSLPPLPGSQRSAAKARHHQIFATREEARASLFEYIEVFFNRIRRHSSLGYMSPAEYARAG